MSVHVVPSREFTAKSLGAKKRHKMNARPQWACIFCCMPHDKPKSRTVRSCLYCKREMAVEYFDSTAELKRWALLRAREKRGEIRNLTFHPRFKFPLRTMQLLYEGDASYFEGDKSVVEDSKGMRTPMFRVKVALMDHFFPGVTITEVNVRG